MKLRRGQLVTTPTPTGRQHRAPCPDCPWARKSIPGWIGPNTIQEWIGCAHSDGRINCHTRTDRAAEHWQCAGGAIYRANICKSPRDPTLLELPPNKIIVFSWGEFERHHAAGLRRIGVDPAGSLED